MTTWASSSTLFVAYLIYFLLEQSLERLAMDARLHLEWDLKALDQCAGLSFRANFNFALVGYLLKGLRQPFLSVKVVQLLQLILRISAKTNHQ